MYGMCWIYKTALRESGDFLHGWQNVGGFGHCSESHRIFDEKFGQTQLLVWFIVPNKRVWSPQLTGNNKTQRQSQNVAWIQPQWTVCPLWALVPRSLQKTYWSMVLSGSSVCVECSDKAWLLRKYTNTHTHTHTHTHTQSTQLTAYSLTCRVGWHCVYCSVLSEHQGH